MNKFAGSLKLPEDVIAAAAEILSEAKKQRLLSGRNPRCVAASAIYIAAILRGKRLTQDRLAKVAQINRFSIQENYKRLYKMLGITVPN